MCRQHLLHSERPLSPPLSHNPLLPVNTTEERSHTRQQVTLPWLITVPHVCSHTHINSVVFLSVRGCACHHHAYDKLNASVLEDVSVFCSRGLWNFFVGWCVSALPWHHLTGAIKSDVSIIPPFSKMLSLTSPHLCFTCSGASNRLNPWWIGDIPPCVCFDCLTHCCLKYFWRVCHMHVQRTVKSFQRLGA